LEHLEAPRFRRGYIKFRLADLAQEAAGASDDWRTANEELEALQVIAATLLKLSSAQRDAHLEHEALQEICHNDVWIGKGWRCSNQRRLRV